MQKSCLIIGLAETGNAVTAYFSRSCLHGAQNFSFPILNDFDSRRRQSYSRDYCSCFSTCNGVRWPECSASDRPLLRRSFAFRTSSGIIFLFACIFLSLISAAQNGKSSSSLITAKSDVAFAKICAICARVA